MTCIQGEFFGAITSALVLLIVLLGRWLCKQPTETGVTDVKVEGNAGECGCHKGALSSKSFFEKIMLFLKDE